MIENLYLWASGHIVVQSQHSWNWSVVREKQVVKFSFNRRSWRSCFENWIWMFQKRECQIVLLIFAVFFCFVLFLCLPCILQGKTNPPANVLAMFFQSNFYSYFLTCNEVKSQKYADTYWGLTDGQLEEVGINVPGRRLKALKSKFCCHHLVYWISTERSLKCISL